MRIVPVLDLKGGLVVHACCGLVARRVRAAAQSTRRGVRALRTLRGAARGAWTRTIYVADLDALTGAPVDVATLSSLASVAEPVDAGAVAVEAALAGGAARDVAIRVCSGWDAGRSVPRRRRR